MVIRGKVTNLSDFCGFFLIAKLMSDYAVMFMMTSQILKFTDLGKRKNKNILKTKHYFFLYKKIINCTLRAILQKKKVFYYQKSSISTYDWYF